MVTAKQRAARALFAKRSKSGYFKRKKKSKPVKARSRSQSRKRVIQVAKRKYTRRRAGSSGKAMLKKFMIGMGVGALVGGSGIIPGVAGYALGGLPGAIGGFMGENVKGIVGGVINGVTGGNGNAGGSW